MSGAVRHVRVLTSCTGSKLPVHHAVPAEELYCGQHHVRLMRGVDAARRAGLRVEVSIVSAGHGIVAGEAPLHPYEQTFQGRSAEDRRNLARSLGIPAAARRELRAPADMHLVLLGEDYLDACALDTDAQPSAPVLAVCGAGSALRTPPMVDVHTVVHTTEDTRRFRCGLVGLKGEIGGRLLEHIARHAPTSQDLCSSALLDKLTETDGGSPSAAATLF